MQGLKALVIGMGVLLIGGIIALVYLIVTEAGKPDVALMPDAMPVEIALPAGSELVAVHPDGERLYLHIETPTGPRILVVDSASGARLGAFAPRARPAE